MIKAIFGERLDETVEAACPIFFRRKLSPNVLTVIGAGISVGAGAAFGLGYPVLGGLLICGGGFFDLVDGVMARRYGLTTRFGGFLDSTLDRLADMAILLGIAVHYSVVGASHLVLLSGFTLVVSVLVSYAQARAELVVPGFKVGVFERGERLVVLALGAISGFLVAALWVVALGSAVTVGQRFSLAHREMTRLDTEEGPDTEEGMEELRGEA